MKQVILGIIIIAILVFGLSRIKMPEPKEMIYPEVSGYVVDEAGVLDEATITTVSATMKEFDEEKNLGQMAVLIVKSTQPLTIEEYSIGLADKWKVGYADEDNGIIFIIATEDRKVRIEVGTGLEPIINDAKAGRLLDEYAVPYLKNNDWNTAVISIVNILRDTVEGGE